MKAGKETEMYNQGYMDGYNDGENARIAPDYWTRLEHQYAGMIVQGMVEHNGVNFLNDAILNVAVQKAHALVEKMKNKEYLV